MICLLTTFSSCKDFTMKFAFTSVFLAVITAVGLSACTATGPCEGLGPCAGGPEYTQLLDPTATDAVSLKGAALDSADRSVTAVTGSLDREDNRASVAGASGMINGEGSSVVLTSGGTITLAGSANLFSTRYVATPAAGDRTTGVIGAATVVTDMPSIGAATYSGDTELTVQDGINSYDLSGTAIIAANFATGAVSTELTNLRGTSVPGFGNSEAVSNVGTIEITGATVSHNAFAGGTARVTSTTLSALSATADTQLSGTFYGSRAAEAGGAFIINDTTAGSLLILGDIISKR
jgi:hypothetical protein